MKNRMGRLGLNGRSGLILLLVLLYAFGGYVSWSLSLGILYAAALPWAAVMIARDRREEGLPEGIAPKLGIAAMAVSMLSALVTMTVDERWGYIVGMSYVCWLLLAMPPKGYAPADARRDLYTVSAWMVSLYMPLALIAMLSVFTGRTFSVPALEGFVGIQKAGVEQGRIEIMAHSNITARYAALNVLFSIYAFIARRGAFRRAWFGLGMVLNVMVLAHAQSRTCNIALAAALGILAMRAVYVWLRGAKGLTAGAVTAAAVFLLTLCALNGIFEADVKLSRVLNEDPKAANAVVSQVERKGQFNVTGNGRGAIWEMALRFLKENPRYLITGMGESDLIALISESHQQMAEYAHVHSSLLAGLMRYGAAYLLCLLGFLCAMIRPAWRLLMRRGSGGLFVVPVFLIVLLLMSLTEEMLFTRQCYSNVLFFFMCGLTLRCGGSAGKEPEKEEKANEN